MDEFISSFIEESCEMLTLLEEDLLHLEKHPGDKEAIKNVFRVMHTLKGAARMYGFENMEGLTHEFETIYDHIRNRKLQLTSEIIDATLKGKDVLLDMLEKKHSTEQEEDLLAYLNEMIPGEKIRAQEGEKNTGTDTPQERANYCVLFFPDKAVFERGLDPDKLIEEIGGAGYKKMVVHEEGESWGVQKANKVCHTSWEVYLNTHISFDELHDIFIFYDEDEYRIIDMARTAAFNDPVIKKLFKKWYKKGIDLKKHVDGQLSELLGGIAGKAAGQPLEKTPEDKETDKTGVSNRSKTDLNSTINVSSEKIDDLMNLVSELVSSTAQLKAQTERYMDFSLNDVIENIEKLTKRFRSNALDLRLVPVGTLLNKFNRHVRDLSKELNKKVTLIIEGQETEIDKTILKSIENPLLHIIRNSIDHGIETVRERNTKGKSEEGLIKIAAFYSGANVVIQIQDDGRGIDVEKVRELAIRKKYIQADQQLSDQEMLNFIMEPGFTTRDEISKLSGRGVGMDVVKKELNAVSGSLEIETEKELGTFITMKLPATLSIIDTLMTEVDTSLILLPLLEIDYCYKVEGEILFSKDNNYIQLHNEMLPYISLREKFNYEKNGSRDSMVIVINKYDRKYGIIVDKIVGEHQAVIKPLGELLMNQPYFSGGSLMVDGKLALILDTNYLFNQVVMN